MLAEPNPSSAAIAAQNSLSISSESLTAFCHSTGRMKRSELFTGLPIQPRFFINPGLVAEGGFGPNAPHIDHRVANRELSFLNEHS